MKTVDKVIAYDLGTGGIKTSLFDVTGKSYAHTFQQYETRFEGVDYHEQSPLAWWDGIIQTTKLLMAETQTKPEEVVGVAISGQSLVVVPIYNV